MARIAALLLCIVHPGGSHAAVESHVGHRSTGVSTHGAFLEWSDMSCSRRHGGGFQEERAKPRNHAMSLSSVSRRRPGAIVPPPPRRVISVFGAEDSGTTMVAQLLTHIFGLAPFGSADTSIAVRSLLKDGIEVQHFSLPWGGECSHHLPPVISEVNTSALAASHRPVARFSVNITSHLQYYRDKAVDATAVLLIRDPDIQALAKTSATSEHVSHCKVRWMAPLENWQAAKLLADAIVRSPEQVVVLDYEAMVTLGRTYVAWALSRPPISLPADYTAAMWPANFTFKSSNTRFVNHPLNHTRDLGSDVAARIELMTRPDW